MIIIYRNLIALLTFPGVLLRQLTSQLICRWLGIIVLKVHYFQLEPPFGSVEHEPLGTAFWPAFWIDVGPIIINSSLGILIAFAASIKIFQLHGGKGADIVMLWLGISLAAQSLPTFTVTSALWMNLLVKRKRIVGRILVAPIVLLILICTAARFLLADLFYGLGVVVLVPLIILALWAGQ